MIQNEIIEEKNKIIEKKNRELSKTLSKVLKLTISKRALFITMVIVVILVLISEGLIDPIIESYAGGFWWAMLGKLVIALLVKPLDMFLEKILMTIEVRKMNRASIS